MTLSVSIEQALGQFRLSAEFSLSAGVSALFGPSGMGKTSVLRAIAGVSKPDQGRIALGGDVLFDADAGVNVPLHRRGIGYVFQDGQLFPHMTVARNLAYGMKGADQFDPVVDMLDLRPVLSRMPATLSGGEARRVALGRALLAKPRFLLLDEPLTGLDEARKSRILPYLERLRDATGIPMLLVSHDMAEVSRLANHIVVMSEGRVTHQAPLAEALADASMAGALGLRELGGILNARLIGHGPDGLSRLEHPAGEMLFPKVEAPEGASLRIRLHAHDIILSNSRPEGLSALNILPATVQALNTGAGGGVLVTLCVGGQPLLARITQRSAHALSLQAGAEVYAILKSVAVARDEISAASGVSTGPCPVP